MNGNKDPTLIKIQLKKRNTVKGSINKHNKFSKRPELYKKSYSRVEILERYTFLLNCKG